MRKPNTAKAAPEAQDLRQRAARARDAAGRFIRRPAPAEPPAADPDPALAAIEAHRSAFEEYERFAAVAGDLPSGHPDYRAANLATNEPCRREIATYEALFEARPTTIAGAASLAAYMCEAVRTAQIDDKPSDGERALRTIADALRGLGPSADASLHPDAALFALGYEFISAWVSEEAVGNEAAYRECTLEAERIAQTPATTVAGLGIKALLLARLDSDDSGPNKPIAAQGPLASHWNVLRQIQEGAARLAAAPDMGIPMSSAAGPEAGFPASGSDAGGRLPAPRHDLSALSIAQLARLHSAVIHAEEAMGSAENRPCFIDRGRFVFTPAGLIIKREADRLSQFSCAIAQEARRREPVDENEREERLNTLISQAILAGGLSEHPEVLSEICTTWGSAR